MTSRYAPRTLTQITPVIVRDAQASLLDRGILADGLDDGASSEAPVLRLCLTQGTWHSRDIITTSGMRPAPKITLRGHRPLLQHLLMRSCKDVALIGREAQRAEVELMASRNFFCLAIRTGHGVLRPRTRDIAKGCHLIQAGCGPDDPLLILYDRNAGNRPFHLPAQADRLREIAHEISLIADVALAPGERLATNIHLC